MYCGISGTVPNDPVVSRLTGRLYERRLIEKYIDENGRDPDLNQPLSKSDLIAVRSGVANGPRAVAASSIPGLLAQLHAEWDGVMLEQFSLRQQLAAAQQELSHALYKHDAACRVIAKLIAERDEARRAAGLPVEAASSAIDKDAKGNVRDVREETASAGVSAVLRSELDTHTARLRAARKNREIPREVPRPDAVERFTEQLDLCPSHVSSAGTAAGVNCVAVTESNNMLAVFSGGSDGKAICYDAHRQSQVATLIGHHGPINGIATALDFVVTCSDDSTTRVWRSEVGNYRCAMTLKGHRGGVNGVALLPTQRHALTAGSDGVLQFQDLEAGVVVGTGRAHETAAGINCLALHPDGFMCATGSAGSLHLWDVRGMEVDIGTAISGNSGNVTSMDFSENGYMMALGTSVGVVQLFDLRRGLEAAVDTIFVDDSGAAPGGRAVPVGQVRFDPSGQYLAAAAGDVKVFHALDDKMRLLAKLGAHLQPVTSVAWCAHAKTLISGSHDRHVKLWAPAPNSH